MRYVLAIAVAGGLLMAWWFITLAMGWRGPSAGVSGEVTNILGNVTIAGVFVWMLRQKKTAGR